MRRVFVIIGIIVLITLTYQNTLHAQRGIQKKVLSPTLSSYAEYRRWEKDIDGITQTVSQFSIPTYLNMPLNESFSLNLVGSAASSAAGSSNLSGLADLKANAVALFADETIMLTAGINLPSGKNELDSEEVLVSAVLSDRAMGFRHNRLGDGLDLNVACGAARAFGNVALGAGIGYLAKGEYEYMEGKKYKPGSQINVTGGFDILLKTLLLRSDVTYSVYQSDKIDDLEVFEEGPRFSIEETLVVPLEKLSVLLSGRYTNRGENEFLYDGLESQTEKIYGDQIDVDGEVNLRSTDTVELKLLFASKFIGEDERGQNDATVLGFGAGVTIRFMRTSSLDLAARYYTGNSDQDTVSLKGFSTTISARVVF